jgi:hypothetical protein
LTPAVWDLAAGRGDGQIADDDKHAKKGDLRLESERSRGVDILDTQRVLQSRQVIMYQSPLGSSPRSLASEQRYYSGRVGKELQDKVISANRAREGEVDIP